MTAKTLKNPNIEMSRVVVYLSETLAGKLREDLMCENFSSIWVELGTPGSKKILVSNVYRDHQWMNQGADKTSKTPQAVMERWQQYLDQWKRALETGSEVHSIGDFNIDSQALLTSKGPQKQLASKTLQAVIERWQQYLDQWKRALETGSEVHSIGDFNIDSQALLTSSWQISC